MEIAVMPGDPPESIWTPGRAPAKSTKEVTCRFSSCSEPTTLIEDETSRAFSVRFWAVTVTLSRLGGADAADAGGAACALAAVAEQSVASAAEATSECLYRFFVFLMVISPVDI
jgi:hypothetical protein